MAQRRKYEILFRVGEPSELQEEIYTTLSTREIESTRYVDETCLIALGILDSVNDMLNTLNLNYFLSFKDPVYAQLTLEFLSSLIFSPNPNTNYSGGTVQFRLFNVEYVFTFSQLANLIQFPHGDDVVCEVPDTEGWHHAFQPFWRVITGTVTHNFKGNKATLIHNPAIRYFRQIWACTIFGRSNSNKVNEKELFYLFATFVPQNVNTVPFMFSHMQAIVNARRGPIIFGGLITSIARVLGLEDKFSCLTPLPPRAIIIDRTRSMKLVKRRQDSNFHLMVANSVFQDFILPNPIRTDVRNPEIIVIFMIRYLTKSPCIFFRM